MASFRSARVTQSLDVPPRVAIGAVPGRLQFHRPPGHQVLDHVASPVKEAPRVDAVLRIALRKFGGAQVGVHGCQSPVSRHTVQIDLLHLDPRPGVAEIQKGAAGAHGAEGARGHHVHLAGGRGDSLFGDQVDDLFGGDHHRLALLDPGVDLLVGFCDRHGYIPVSSLEFTKK